MFKHVSVQITPCVFNCDNKDVCYLKKRNKYNDKLDFYNVFKIFNKEDYTVYLSICDITSLNLARILLKCINNLNITIPYSIYKDHKISKEKHDNDKISLSVYNIKDILDAPANYTKIFLIKNDESYKLAKIILTSHGFINIHLAIDINYIDEYKIKELLKLKEQTQSIGISLDSCLENYSLHKKCVYNDNYVDIDYDNTYRKCPFVKCGTLINTESFEELINNKIKPNCIYHKVFGGTNE